VVATASAPRVRFVRLRRAGGERRLAILDPVTRDRYVRLVAVAAGGVEARLSDAVVANRVRSWRVEPPELRLRPWRVERRVFAARVSALARTAGTIAFADVRRCYASISPATVGVALRRDGIETADALERFLCDLERAGVAGLPVGPEPSAVLANAVLAAVDRALERAGIRHLRWVDDVVLAGQDPAAALQVLRDALATIGLRLNERKTRVVLDPRAIGVPNGMSPSR
jgi:Reverse transcriptase (RNA-dependent DNA polymerase)